MRLLPSLERPPGSSKMSPLSVGLRWILLVLTLACLTTPTESQQRGNYTSAPQKQRKIGRKSKKSREKQSENIENRLEILMVLNYIYHILFTTIYFPYMFIGIRSESLHHVCESYIMIIYINILLWPNSYIKN